MVQRQGFYTIRRTTSSPTLREVRVLRSGKIFALEVTQGTTKKKLAGFFRGHPIRNHAPRAFNSDYPGNGLILHNNPDSLVHKVLF
jgi:hypothetical protein